MILTKAEAAQVARVSEKTLARSKAAMPSVRFHDLRHSCASLLLAAGVDLYTISRILGHSSIQMTQRYAHLQTDALKKAMRFRYSAPKWL